MNILILMLSAFMAQGAASVEGVVVKMGSGEPIAGARVELHPEKGGEPSGDRRPETYTATTSENGKFTFDQVAPATYRLIATRNNYVPAEYGQRSPATQGIPVELTSGQKMPAVQLAMASTGSISGRIYDRDGEPVGKGQVQALRSIYKDGRRVLTIVQTVETNDRGEYRLFWLAPGRYYVSAKPDIPQLPVDMRSPGGATASAARVTGAARFGTYEQASAPVVRKRILKSGEVIEETYISTYYPGVIDSQAASPIALGAGATVGGVDISVAPGLAPARHIRGKILDATTGQPLARANVMALPRTSEPLRTIPIGASDPNGNFDIAGAAPGPYLVVASSTRLSGMLTVEVANADLQNITIVAKPGFDVSGRFTVEGRSRSGNQLRVTDLRVDRFVRDPDMVGMPSSGPTFNPPVSPDGSFTLAGISVGDFRVTVRTGSPDAYVKSMRMGNADVLDGGLHLSGPPENPLEIVVGANAGRVGGSVVGARQEPLPNRTVVLVPDVRFRHRADLYKTVSTDTAGRFQMQGITPGSYQLFGWDEVETGAWQDPDFIRIYEGRGKNIQINEGSDENVQVTVIP
jgi:hypothetical protein